MTADMPDDDFFGDPFDTGAKPSEGGWRNGLIMAGKNLKPVAANAITILSNDIGWKGVLVYDEMRELPVFVGDPPWHEHDCPQTKDRGPLTDGAIIRCQAWLARTHSLFLSTQATTDAMLVVAERRRVNAVAEYLRGLKWDAVPRTNTWLHDICGADDTEYTRTIGVKWLIAAVARTMRPGCMVHNIPVFEGSQYAGKSSIIRVLARRPEWLFDSDLDIGSKDALQVLAGKWIVELAEMHAYSRAHAAAVKSFITRAIDTYRPSYGRGARDFRRRWVGAGTTNQDRYLTDTTGNRRWWPVTVGKVDLDHLERVADQLWAEAVVRYDQGEAWHVDSDHFGRLAAGEQRAREQLDPWCEPINDWIQSKRVLLSVHGITTAEVLGECLKIETGRWTRADEMRASECLKQLGWGRRERKRDHSSGERVYRFWPPVSAVSEEGTG